MLNAPCFVPSVVIWSWLDWCEVAEWSALVVSLLGDTPAVTNNSYKNIISIHNYFHSSMLHGTYYEPAIHTHIGQCLLYGTWGGLQWASCMWPHKKKFASISLTFSSNNSQDKDVSIVARLPLCFNDVVALFIRVCHPGTLLLRYNYVNILVQFPDN